jgi:calcineurin-like phosphoesterase family protein
MKEWLITDTHFDHDNIGVYCDRPAGWMDRILKNWRRMVQKDDLVLHLGDVMVGNRRSLLDMMNSLPGAKVLVRGNHDAKSTLWYIRNGFVFATDGLSHKGVTFTHRPAALLSCGTDINVHGHVHNTPWKSTQSFQRLLAIEHVEYRPVALQKWIDMARSPNAWAAYRAKWPIPVVVGRRPR